MLYYYIITYIIIIGKSYQEFTQSATWEIIRI